MKFFLACLIAITPLVGCNAIAGAASGPAKVEAGTPAHQKAAVDAAVAFLKQLDSGAIDGTWGQASPYLHQLTNQTAWSVGLRTFRGGVGAFKSRKLKGIGFTHTVDGVPPGDYVAVGFDATFSNFTVEEKVVLHNAKGTWRVMGYFLSKTLSAHL